MRISEKEDIPLLLQWFNDVSFAGDYQHYPDQISYAELERQIVERKKYQHEWVDFIIETKDGKKIGWAVHYVGAPNFGWTEIGYTIIPSEQNKGYGTEAVMILVDYLFLTRDIIRVQAVIDAKNMASRRVLEKAGFKKEGTLRKALWNSKGTWTHGHLYSLIREEWKEPKILTKTM